MAAVSDNLYNEFWWPLDTTEKQNDIFLETKNSLIYNKFIDVDEYVLNTCEKIDTLLRSVVQEVLSSDRLSLISHMIVGWGNSATPDGEVLSAIPSLLQATLHGWTIPQLSSEGDVHPWQFHAYSALAGISPDYKFDQLGISLKDLASSLINIPTSDSAELGHILLTLFLEEEAYGDLEIRIKGNKVSRCELVERALDAHINGHFFVCRKYHLTEAICLAGANKDIDLKKFRPAAEQLLSAQLDMGIFLLFVLRESVKYWNDKSAFIVSTSDVKEIRKLLAIWNQIENHFYLAGHIIELAALASKKGYNISVIHRNMINEMIVLLNFIVDGSIDNLSMDPSLLGFSHYRRGITMWNYCMHSERYFKFSQFTADLSSRSPRRPRHKSYRPIGGQFIAAPDMQLPSERLSEISRAITTHCNGLIGPIGTYPHFFRYRWSSWPREVHFELLESESGITFDLHIESPKYLFIMDVTHDLVKRFNEDKSKFLYKIDEGWQKDGIRVYFDLSTQFSSEELSRQAAKFVEYFSNGLKTFF